MKKFLQPVPYEELRPGFWRFQDTCNVYLLRLNEEAIAIDFGSEAWMFHFHFEFGREGRDSLMGIIESAAVPAWDHVLPMPHP